MVSAIWGKVAVKCLKIGDIYVAGTNWALQILNDIFAAHYEDFQMPLTIPMLEFGAPEKFQVRMNVMFVY